MCHGSNKIRVTLVCTCSPRVKSVMKVVCLTNNKADTEICTLWRKKTSWNNYFAFILWRTPKYSHISLCVDIFIFTLWVVWLYSGATTNHTSLTAALLLLLIITPVISFHFSIKEVINIHYWTFLSLISGLIRSYYTKYCCTSAIWVH